MTRKTELSWKMMSLNLRYGMNQTNGSHPPSYLLLECSVLAMQGEEITVEAWEGAFFPVVDAYWVGMPLQKKIEINR